VSKGEDFILKAPQELNYSSFYLTDIAGNVIGSKNGYGTVIGAAGNPLVVSLAGIDLAGIMAAGDCFRIKIGDLLSNPFQYIGCNTENTLLFEIWDDDDNMHQRIRLRCTIDNPQAKTGKEEYEDMNGRVWSLSKKRRKEFDLTTDFYPDSVHDAIREMFLYPHLTVDETAMYESGDYEVDWENKDEDGNAKGTTGLSEQSISRWSNCLSA
jgi:hypothetical protein